MGSNLSKTIDFTKKAILVFIAFAILSFIFQWISVSLSEDPSVPIPTDGDTSAYLLADNKFDKIPNPDLNSLTLKDNTTASFAITSNKKLPQFPSTVNVYEIEDFRDKLGNSDNARRIAQILNFSSEEDSIVDNTLYWFNRTNSRTFSYNKITQEWSLEVDLATDLIAQQSIPLNNEGDYNQLGKDILTTLTLSTEYHTDANSMVQYINIGDDGKYKYAINSDFAKYVRIAQYKNIEASTLKDQFNEEYVIGPTTTYLADIRKPSYLDAPAEFIVQNTESEDILNDLIKFKYRAFEYGDVGIYPLIDVELAWENIQRNQGILYYLKPVGEDPFTPYQQLNIREFRIDADETKLVYIEPEDKILSDKWTHYLQPFYMFSGTALVDDGRKAEFSFLIRALTPSSYQD